MPIVNVLMNIMSDSISGGAAVFRCPIIIGLFQIHNLTFDSFLPFSVDTKFCFSLTAIVRAQNTKNFVSALIVNTNFTYKT